MLLESVRLALRSVRRNALRSLLTLLGIVIGVAAVIAVVTIGNGTTRRIEADIARLGSNLLVIRADSGGRPGGPRSGVRPLGQPELQALRRGLRGADAVSGAAWQTVRIVNGTDSRPSTVTGTDPQYLKVRDWKIAAGRALNHEAHDSSDTCLIGETVRREFFGAANPVGLRIRVGRLSCRIAGLLQPKGVSGFGTDQDDVIIVPLATFHQRLAGNRDVARIYVSAMDGVDTAAVQGEIEAILRDVRRIAPGAEHDFSVRDMTQVAETMTSTTRLMTGVLGALAGVSLLVGGIGIMNVMLVSVTERTGEIGIRLAIGAHERHILTQFLVEAAVLSVIGGLIGIVVGLGLGAAATAWLSIPFSPGITIIPVAAGFSALVGVIFGFFPALRGARLDPIDALRHE